MIASDDGKVRVLSWDEATGGTWHDMAVLVQYLQRTEACMWNGLIVILRKNPMDLPPDLLYEMHTLKNRSRHLLPVLWMGTLDRATTTTVCFVFSIADTGVTVCDACIDERLQFILPLGERK